MENIFKILTINPGSTSTKMAVFDNEELSVWKNIKTFFRREIGKYEKYRPIWI